MKAQVLAARTQLAKTLTKLLYGNRQLGLYNEVSDSQFIAPAELTAAVGLTAGAVLNTTSGWFKFSYKGKTLFVAKKAFRSGVSHTDLDAKGILTGQKTLRIGGLLYRVRCLQGLNGNTISAMAAGTLLTDNATLLDCEFSELMYRVSADSGLTGASSWLKYALTAIGFGSNYEVGAATICMEKMPSLYNLFRGFAGIKASHKGDFSGSPTTRGWRPVLELVEPMTFQGEVAQSDLITSAALVSALGMTAGTAIAANANVPWQKVTQDGITRYIAKKPFRNNLSWVALNDMGIATGTKTIQIGGRTYKVRLLKGSQMNGTSVLPASVTGFDSPASQYSEWNTNLYHLFNGVHGNASNTMASEGISVGDKAQYTEAQLGIGSAEQGRWTLCQELNSDGTAVCRGGDGISSISGATASASSPIFGWRPVLELVG